MPDEFESEAGAGGSMARRLSNAMRCCLIGRIAGFFCTGKVAEHEAQVEAREGGRIGSDSANFRARHAEPRHAAVDLDRDGQWPGSTTSGRPPGCKLLDAVCHGGQIVCRADILGPGVEPVEDEDFWLGADGAPKRQSFGSVRDEERRTALFAQRRSDFGGAEPVAVGFHHRSAGCVRQSGTQPAEVLADCTEVNRQDGTGLREVWPVGRIMHAGHLVLSECFHQ